ncbi:MAG: efflux RND transporter permease subunit [Spirochaetaceae bacterium]|jgi:multidrug efflux pump subunit AcrB|nr:efflux RND transporter permease subunit [Spirochaetaceae bacterium]
MDIAELSVRKPVTVTMLYLVVMVVAAVFIPRLSIELFPSMEMPTVMVMTSYSNIGPEEIDETVTQPIVNALSRVSDVEDITSRSSSGNSQVQVQFGYNKDMDEAFSDVQTAVNQMIRQLPDGADSPTVFRFGMSAMPIMRLALTGDIDLNSLREIAENTVQPYLERINGVAEADVNGGAVSKVEVTVNNNRLEAYGLTLTNIVSALSARNIQVTNGTITMGDMDFQIITDEYYSSLDDIRGTIITGTGASVVRLSDVADVAMVYDTTGRKVYINGVPGIYMSITNDAATNPSDISKAVYAMLPTINEALPVGLEVNVLSDDSTMIDSTMSEVYSSLIQGAILAMLVIFMFLRNFRSSIIIGLSIPISIVITLAVMAIMDLSINLMTMSGLILGMGMTVDSSIVILENINKRRSWGEKPAIAAIFGSNNMLLAIIASTATTVCVFVPMLIYRAELEMYGMMFQELVVTVVASLIVSLIVSITLVPALAGSILPVYTRTQKPLKFKPIIKIDNIFASGITKMQNGYARSLQFCLNNRLFVLVLVVAMMIPAIQSLSMSGMNLAPANSADDQVNVTITLPIGTNNVITADYLFKFQDTIKKEIPPEAIKSIVMNAGSSNSGSIQINMPPLGEQPMSALEIQNKLRPFLKQWSDVTIAFSSGRGPGGGSNVQVQVVSDNDNAAAQVCDQILSIFNTMPSLQNPSSDLSSGSPRYSIRIDTDAAAAAGVSVNTISNILRTAIAGTTATYFHTGSDDIDIIVQLDENDLLDPTDLGAITVTTQNGPMSLDNFITTVRGVSPRQIQRENGVRVSNVSATLAQGQIMTVVQVEVEQKINQNIVLPEGVTIQYAGAAQDLQRFGGAFILVIGLALFLVYAVMAAQFESLVDPFIIFASIPLLAIGVAAVYGLLNQTMSLYTFVGVVALVGIVVNNGIVLVDFTNQLVEQKMPVKEACVEAGRNRLVPILMSTLTTVIGMVPIAFFPGEGAQSMQPIALTIVGGMSSGAFMTLFVSPTLYSIFNKRREKRFDDPESLMNQLEEVDKIKHSGNRVQIINRAGEK